MVVPSLFEETSALTAELAPPTKSACFAFNMRANEATPPPTADGDLARAASFLLSFSPGRGPTVELESVSLPVASSLATRDKALGCIEGAVPANADDDAETVGT